MQELIFQLADILIVVVNDLTVLEQEFLQKMHSRMQLAREIKVQHLIVVHNFRDCHKEKEALELWKVTFIIQVISIVFENCFSFMVSQSLRDSKNTVISTLCIFTILQQQVLEIYACGRSETIRVTAAPRDNPTRYSAVHVHIHQSELARHIFLANDSSDFGSKYNNWSIAQLKYWIEGIYTNKKREYLPLELIREHTERLLPSYIENAGRVYLAADYQYRMQDRPGKPAHKFRDWRVDVFPILFPILVPSENAYSEEKFEPKVIIS